MAEITAFYGYRFSCEDFIKIFYPLWHSRLPAKYDAKKLCRKLSPRFTPEGYASTECFIPNQYVENKLEIPLFDLFHVDRLDSLNDTKKVSYVLIGETLSTSVFYGNDIEENIDFLDIQENLKRKVDCLPETLCIHFEKPVLYMYCSGSN